MASFNALTNSAWALFHAREAETAAQISFNENITECFNAGATSGEIATAVAGHATFSQVALALYSVGPDSAVEDVFQCMPDDDGSGLTRDELASVTGVSMHDLVLYQRLHFVRHGEEVRYQIDQQFLLQTDPPQLR